MLCTYGFGWFKADSVYTVCFFTFYCTDYIIRQGITPSSTIISDLEVHLPQKQKTKKIKIIKKIHFWQVVRLRCHLFDHIHIFSVKLVN